MFPADQWSLPLQPHIPAPSSVCASRTDRYRFPLLSAPLQRRCKPPVSRREAPDCHASSPRMASFPGLCKAVGPAEENGELDGSLQQMLKAIAEERNRLTLRQELSGLGELLIGLCFIYYAGG